MDLTNRTWHTLRISRCIFFEELRKPISKASEIPNRIFNLFLPVACNKNSLTFQASERIFLVFSPTRIGLKCVLAHFFLEILSRKHPREHRSVRLLNDDITRLEMCTLWRTQSSKGRRSLPHTLLKVISWHAYLFIISYLFI